MPWVLSNPAGSKARGGERWGEGSPCNFSIFSHFPDRQMEGLYCSSRRGSWGGTSAALHVSGPLNPLELRLAQYMPSMPTARLCGNSCWDPKGTGRWPRRALQLPRPPLKAGMGDQGEGCPKAAAKTRPLLWDEEKCAFAGKAEAKHPSFQGRPWESPQPNYLAFNGMF